MAAHRPLQAKRAANYRCDGADPANPFAIQRFRALGYEVTTDVFEVQLPGLPSASVALPLAAALRDALARKLGVEDAEMGMTATQTMGEDGMGCWSILIYDKAPGGAGFSVAAGNHVEDLLKDAVAILDCPNGAICKTGCPECVMCRDLESHESQIDRIGAFRLAKSLVRQLGLPSELAIFGAGTRAESQPLADAILREMEQRPDAELVLWLLGNSSDWDLNRWTALRIAQRLAARERRIRIILDESTLNDLDLAGRIELYGLAIKTGCILEGAPSLPLVKNHQVLAWVGEGDKGLAWAHRDKTAGIGNASWGGSGKELLVRGDFKIVGVRSQLVDPTKFLMSPERTTLIYVTTQLDGDIEAFGAAFWSLVAKNAPSIGRRASATTALRSIGYSDRYLNSPLPVRLLREVLTKAPGIDAATIVRLTTGDAVSGILHSSPTLLKHDWRLNAHRDVVLQDVFAADFGSRFCLIKRPKHQVTHGRTLRLEYVDGVVSVLLDQGFGYWVPQRPIRFDFSAGGVDQVRDLRRVRFFVEPGQSNASWICVNEES
ncbi:MAG: DUF1998 domain-containing protein [Armatimonadetes bacterium]|nr:DUF1998 domain-containing protein [Armatimonadota bacterium]